MAKNIRVTKKMRNIIDFYKEQYCYDLDYDLWTDSDFVTCIMTKWIKQNYDHNTCDDVLNRP